MLAADVRGAEEAHFTDVDQCVCHTPNPDNKFSVPLIFAPLHALREFHTGPLTILQFAAED